MAAAGPVGEKLINKKEKALKAREEELRRNLQELGEDVAAITGQTASNGNQSAADSTSPTSNNSIVNNNSSNNNKKKKGSRSSEKQLKIKLWPGKGLKSKENAEPLAVKEDNDADANADDDDFEEQQQDQQQPKVAMIKRQQRLPIKKLPDDISHLFTPHVPAAAVVAAATTATKRTSNRKMVGPQQGLDTVNGKRFVSVGSSALSDPAPASATHRSSPSSSSDLMADGPNVSVKRPLQSPDLPSPR